MGQWIDEGKISPGYQIDHQIALASPLRNEADDISNPRLKTIADHRARHFSYHPWRLK